MAQEWHVQASCDVCVHGCSHDVALCELRAQRSGTPMSTEPLSSRTVVWRQMRVPAMSVTSEPRAGSSMWTHMSCDTSGKGAAAHSEVTYMNAAQDRGWGRRRPALQTSASSTRRGSLCMWRWRVALASLATTLSWRIAAQSPRAPGRSR